MQFVEETALVSFYCVDRTEEVVSNLLGGQTFGSTQKDGFLHQRQFHVLIEW